MKKVEKAISRLIIEWTDGSEFGWPPVCNGLFHQPERPVSVAEKGTKDNDATSEKD